MIVLFAETSICRRRYITEKKAATRLSIKKTMILNSIAMQNLMICLLLFSSHFGDLSSSELPHGMESGLLHHNVSLHPHPHEAGVTRQSLVLDGKDQGFLSCNTVSWHTSSPWWWIEGGLSPRGQERIAHRDIGLIGQSSPPDTTWLTVKAQKGDYQDRLLKRYNLQAYQCNFDQFRKLNFLKAKDQLEKNQSYKLPILVHRYDGKSIRNTIKISDLDQALRIAKFNDVALSNSTRTDDFRISRQLWVPYHELKCPPAGEAAKATDAETNQPSISAQKSHLKAPRPSIGNRDFPIFGEKYAHTELIDQKLSGKVFYVVSGHGGIDSGAQGKRAKRTLCEDEYAYDVALRLTRLLVSHGATTYLIVRDPNDGIRDTDYLDCDTDELLWGDKPTADGQKKRLQDRTDAINTLVSNYTARGLTDQTLIEIHVDSRSVSATTDVYFYHKPESEPSANLAKRIHETFLLKYAKVRATRRYSGTVTSRGLFMLMETKAPKAVYVELGNIRNVYDQLRLIMPKNRQLLAQWMLEGIKD
jgi:N-acetylmuramoyl-L-alanine amidase